MKIFKFKTNINSSICLDRVASYLDNTADIMCWYVDTEGVDKILTVEANERLERRDVVDIVSLAGFLARPLKTGVLTKIFGA